MLPSPSKGHEEIINDLELFRPVKLPNVDKQSLVVHYTNGKGEKRITGSSSLKSSQAYPIGFFSADSIKFSCRRNM